MVLTPLLFRAVFTLALVTITWLALTPAPPEITGWLGWDKANHCLAFIVLAGLGHGAFPARLLPTSLGLVSYGLLIELMQALTRNRYFELADLLADSVGIAIYVALFHLLADHLAKFPFIRTLLAIDKSD